MRTLVLGGTGFVGSWIVRALLDRGHETVVLGHARGDLDPRADFMAGDFRDPIAVRRAMTCCEGVIDAGAYYPRYSIHREEQKELALTELRVILNAARMTGIRSFVFTSTLSVANNDPHAQLYSTYHYIKKALHDEVVKAIAEGLPGSIAIPGACFGPGDTKPTTGRAIVEIASRRLRFVLEGKMNVVDVRDVAKAEVIMLERAAPGSVYQLGNWNCMCSEFTTRVAGIAGVPPPHIQVPYWPSKLAALAMEEIQFHAGAHLPLLPQSGLDLIHYGAFLDSSAAVRDLEWAPRPVDETIADTIAWFRQHHYLSSFRRGRVSLPPVAGPQAQRHAV